jgi:hypothetical protein
MNCTPIFRAHTETKQRRRRGKASNQRRIPKWPPYALAFDCETRIDEKKSLTFGFARLLRNSKDTYNDCRAEIAFYDPEELTPAEINILKQFVARKRAETAKDVYSRDIQLLTRQEFVEQFLFPHAEAGSLIVGFNLPFDITRLPSSARPATRLNEDWSLVFANRSSNPDTLQKGEFRIKVDRKDGKIAFFALSGSFEHKGRFSSEGRFLDLFALAWSLTNTSYSLKGLAKDLRKRGYQVPQKLEHKPTGRVTRKEIVYGRHDVRVTVGILNALRAEFDLHRDIDLNPDNAVSPASIFKAYLQGMGISLPSEKFRLSPKIQGIAAQAYYGGRSEVRIRLADVPVVHTDFLSEYPTVIILMGLWQLLTAKRLRIRPATHDVRTLLENVLANQDLVFDRKLWKQFTGYALVEPQNDVLPVRTEYKETSPDTNIGVNILESSDHPIWFAIPDLVDSVLLARKVPKVLKAFRIFPEEPEKGLRAIALRGKEKVNPVTGNLFKTLIESKEREKKNDKEQAYFLKIMANSGYGIFIETTPKRLSKPVQLTVFSGEHRFKTPSTIMEEKGKFYCPLISSLITAAGRLLLGILERDVQNVEGTYLFCDTDSMAIVAEKESRLIRLTAPEAKNQQKVKTLSWKEAKKIVAKFELLNPYSFQGSILKVEKESLDRQLYGFGISAKRYCLFDEQWRIVHASSHGLGYLFFPSTWNKRVEAPQWVCEAWEYIIKNDPNTKKPSWFRQPAMMRIATTTPKVQIWKVINEKQQGLPYRLQIKPNNFVKSPIVDRQNGLPKGVNGENFMLIAAFSDDSNEWYGTYTNVHDGKQYNLVPLESKKPFEASPLTLEQIVRMHTNHAESKSLSPDGSPCTFLTKGLLQRLPLTAKGFPRFVGKETDRRWEQEEDPSLFEPMLVEFKPNETTRITTDANLQRMIRDDGRSVRELAKELKMNPSTIQRARSGKRIRKTIAQKIRKYLQKQ